MGDHYVVLLNHAVTIGHEIPLENFKQYLNDLYKEFDQELTKTLFNVIREIPDGA